MNTYKDKILAQFEPDIANKLLEFANNLSTQDCDVFVFMSRKFCCLYDVLISLGVPPVQKPIVSDKVLDLETDFFKDKIVRIVDDVIICGTTLWKAKERLLKHYKAKEVKTSVFCVNDKYWVKKLIEPDYKSVVLTDDRSLTFCSSIVRSLSISPRPYATEFPYFVNVDIKTQHWHRILSSKNWNVYDITDKFQEDNGISTLTFFPSSGVLDEIKQSFGECLDAVIDIAKIRVYAKNIGWAMRLSMLPIVTLKPLVKKDVDLIFDNLINKIRSLNINSDFTERLYSELSNPVSKLRFVQYVFALLLASKFKFGIQKNLQNHINLELRDLDVELLFGKWNLPAIKALAAIYLNQESQLSLNVGDIEPATLDLKNTELPALIKDKNEKPTTNNISENLKEFPRNIFSDFADIFISLYYEKEIPSREKVKAAAKQQDWESIKKIDRLETGITWIGILKYFQTIFGYELTPKVKNVLSLVLDYSIDRGFCVPVTRYDPDTDIIFRAYRHGEDVKFGDQETELAGIAIDAAQKALQSNEISRLFLEKLLVLFMRIGASKDILRVQYGTSGQDGIAKIGFHLQGAVAKLKKRNSYRLDSDIWLSKHLSEKGVIKEIGSNKGYTFYKHKSGIQIKSSSRIEAQKFGHILGTLHKGVSSKSEHINLSRDDLIFLSTCFRPKDVAAALFVELEFYIENLFPLIENINEDWEKIWFNKSETRKQIWLNSGFEALNSLHKKTTGWFNNGAARAIEKGSLILDRLDQYTTKLDWEGYWSALEILKREDEENKFDDLIIQMVSVGHRLLLNINLLEVILSLTKENPSYQNNKQLKQSIDKLNNFYKKSVAIRRDIFIQKDHRSIENLNNHIASDFSGFDENIFLKKIIKDVYELNVKLSRIMPMTDRALDDFEQKPDGTTTYDYVVYYDIVDSTATKKIKTEVEVESFRTNVKKVKFAINDFINAMESEMLKVGEEIYCWNGDASSTNDAKYVFFSSSKQGLSIRRAKEFIDRLFANATSQISFRVIAAPTNAFYSNVFRNRQRTEVEGEQFWEHYSRVHKKFKELETQFATHKNLVLVIGNEAMPPASKKLNLNSKLWDDTIETLIAGAYYKTKGELWTPKSKTRSK